MAASLDSNDPFLCFDYLKSLPEDQAIKWLSESVKPAALKAAAKQREDGQKYARAKRPPVAASKGSADKKRATSVATLKAQLNDVARQTVQKDNEKLQLALCDYGDWSLQLKSKAADSNNGDIGHIVSNGSFSSLTENQKTPEMLGSFINQKEKLVDDLHRYTLITIYDIGAAFAELQPKLKMASRTMKEFLVSNRSATDPGKISKYISFFRLCNSYPRLLYLQGVSWTKIYNNRFRLMPNFEKDLVFWQEPPNKSFKVIIGTDISHYATPDGTKEGLKALETDTIKYAQAVQKRAEQIGGIVAEAGYGLTMIDGQIGSLSLSDTTFKEVNGKDEDNMSDIDEE